MQNTLRAVIRAKDQNGVEINIGDKFKRNVHGLSKWTDTVIEIKNQAWGLVVYGEKNGYAVSYEVNEIVITD